MAVRYRVSAYQTSYVDATDRLDQDGWRTVDIQMFECDETGVEDVFSIIVANTIDIAGMLSRMGKNDEHWFTGKKALPKSILLEFFLVAFEMEIQPGKSYEGKWVEASPSYYGN